MAELSHFDERGASRMVDVAGKEITERIATASATVRMLPATAATIKDRKIAKGDVLEVARLAGIMAAKKTSDLIPLCHPLPISGVNVEFAWDGDLLQIFSTVKVVARTGVEMEALASASVAAMTVYDMCKAIDRGMTIERIRLEQKSGGRTGDFTRSAEST
jgi:cyclic pyranopterin monophosphate synthase